MRCALLIAVLAGRAVAAPGDWAPQRDAFDPQVIARYEQQLARDPFDAATLSRLARLYTGRHTTDELEQALPSDPTGDLVRAQLRILRKDRAGATGFYLRALEHAPRGPFAARAWFALAELDRDRGDPAAARAAYAQVLAATPPAPLARRALRQLTALGVLARDPRTDDYFAQLIDLAPNDPDIWLERGDALVAKEPWRAEDSFAHAEELLARDPQRRLDAIARRGDAQAKDHRPDEAIATYRRAIALAPRGYFLIGELLGRIVDVARSEHALPALATELEAGWPERTRGYLEWATLASLYLEVRTPDEAIVAFEHAARLAPWELATQRTLIALLIKQGRDPRAQLRAAIRAAPSEPSLQLDLAKRTWPDPAALDQLDRTARQFARDGSVLQAVATQLVDFERPERAEKWFEALCRLEPDDEAHWLDLARAYFAADNHRGAIDAWRRVARDQPGAKLQFANLLLDEGDIHSARSMIDEAILLDMMNPEAWRLRAIADDQLGDIKTAIDDAEHEVRLTRPDRAALHRARHHVVQLALKAKPDPEVWTDEDADLWSQHLTAWHDAFFAAKPDLDAGYYFLEATVEHSCLAELMRDCYDARETAERLAKLVADDPDVLRVLIKIYEDLGMHRAAAGKIARLIPLEPLAQRPLLEEKLALEHLQPDDVPSHMPLEDMLAVRASSSEVESTELGAARPIELGLAIAYGATLRGDAGGTIGLGGYVRRTLDAGSNGVEARLDWTQGGDGHSGAGTAIGVWHMFEPLVSAATVSAGFAQRLDLRSGTPATIASDADVVFALHEAPLELGLRFEQRYVGALDTRGLLEIRVHLY